MLIHNSCKKYYPQIFLEESHYVIKSRKITNRNKDHLELSESDEESCDESDK